MSLSPLSALASGRPRARELLASFVLGGFLSGALLLYEPPSPVFAQSVPGSAERGALVQKVSFRGVESLDEGAVGKAILTRPSRCRSFLLKPFCWISDAGLFEERHRLDPEKLPRDELRIRVFYWLRGYRDTEVASEVMPAEDGVEVRFDVAEAPPTLIRALEVRQARPVLSHSEVEAADLPPEGEPLDMIRLRLAEQRLREALWEKGFADAAIRDTVRIDTLPAGPRFARVGVDVSPGRPVTIGKIVVRGNERVSERTILRSLGLQSGRLYRPSDMEEARRRLYRSNLFRQTLVRAAGEAAAADAEADTIAGPPLTRAALRNPSDSPTGAEDLDPARAPPPDADTTRTVVVTVREAPFREVGLGAGFNTVDFVQAQARYTRYNWFGGARRLTLRATVGNLLGPQLFDRSIFGSAVPAGVSGEVEPAFLDPTWDLSAEVVQPWFLSSHNSVGGGVFARRRTVPGVVIDRSFGASATFTRRLARDLSASLTYKFESTAVEAGDIYFCANFGICRTSTIEALRSLQGLSPLELTVRAELTDDPRHPTRGLAARLSAEHASALTASDYRYNRATGEVAYYLGLGPGVLAARGRVGWVRPLESTDAALGADVPGGTILHPRKQFYAGGSRSVRGFGESQLGPRVLTVAPARLLAAPDSGRGAGCTVETIRDRSCDPSGVPSADFEPRPLGGDAVIEGSVEYRFPLFGRLGGAVFVDAGFVEDSDLEVPSSSRGTVTPGFGLRFLSPVGMIRVDLGVRPTLVEELPVLTELPGGGDDRLVALETPMRFDPLEDSGGFDTVLQRLVLHLSIGEAF